MIIRGSFENVADRLLLNNEDLLNWVEGALPKFLHRYNFTVCYGIMKSDHDMGEVELFEAQKKTRNFPMLSISLRK